MKHIDEKSACGVGILASRENKATHEILQKTLQALACEEHRGGCTADLRTSDGAGIMTDIPFKLLGYECGTVAVAHLFAPDLPAQRRQVLQVFEDTFGFFDLQIIAYRETPISPTILGKDARERMPYILQAVIKRPEHSMTEGAFDKLLYTAKQLTRTKLSKKNLPELFFVSLSSHTIVYKALTVAEDLPAFYLDLQNPAFETRFGMFHRRFSTNTNTTWDKAQPFRLIGHNGEFNTIKGNRDWAVSREKSLGLYKGELLTEDGISDSGSLNEMAEAMLFRSSIPYIDEVLAIMMPPAQYEHSFYDFWSRAMEPWDGPALVTYSDGLNVGARLDRNGFRPCRWAMTKEYFYLASEAGSFELNEAEIESKGALKAGTGVRVSLNSGNIYFVDPSQSRYNFDVKFDSRTIKLPYKSPTSPQPQSEEQETKEHPPFGGRGAFLFNYTQEDFQKMLLPMIQAGKEAIGSMGDTARLAIFSKEVRSFFDYFYHNFAQVTNPPLDYIREKLVTDLRMYLGKRPNIFAKKELLPAPIAFEVPSPILGLGQLAYLASLKEENTNEPRILAREFDTTFRKSHGEVGFRSKLKQLAKDVKQAVNEGVSIVILTDKNANYENLPIPCLLALRIIATEMRDSGMRLKFSIIIHSGELRTTHQIATTIGMGASAVCPYLALEIARNETHKDVAHLSPEQREKNLIKAYEDGLLKIMAKMGISVVRSYQSSRLFTSIGIAEDLIDIYFEGVTPKLGGIGWAEIVHDLIEKSEKARLAEEANTLPNAYIFKEHSRGLVGEKHSMTASRSKIIHELVRKTGLGLDNWELYAEYLKASDEEEPVSIRHLFALKKGRQQREERGEKDPSLENILATFGSGAMSYGAISAEAQRDIFLAMQAIGGRSNSGEGGENPYYYTEGITAHIKQVASGRFGANALYLISGKEIQIKVAQGAKPGEGGQLMGMKVNADIAKARYASEGIDLISPPPLHDIYSIEDLKELIYEFRQLHPEAKISVKLVAGAGIGTIAVGVAKAGADIIHISGGEGGTGAATLSSMKHAGLPWELGLWEAHQTLLANGLRSQVILRTDGGLHSGKEILTAAILGAEQYDFGKLLLVAQGCVMARVCEKNTCPTGIATHDARFKAKYQGTKEHIVTMLKYLAEDVKRNLYAMGFANMREVIGRTDLLEVNPCLHDLIRLKRLDLGFILDKPAPYLPAPTFAGNTLFAEGLSELNKLLSYNLPSSPSNFEEGQNPTLQIGEGAESEVIKISVKDRAIPATLAGKIALAQHHKNFPPSLSNLEEGQKPTLYKTSLSFEGSAGQGFGVFLTEGIELRLFGEANDSVGKMMAGGKIIICPSRQARFKAEENVIIGNVALYGATGGTLYVNGIAADRFAVRNSGAIAVVEGVGMHACEYMTRGKVVILGETSYNVGSGMTGGELIVLGNKEDYLNKDYIAPLAFEAQELEDLKILLQDYHHETQSKRAQYILENWEEIQHYFTRYVPKAMIKKQESINA